jgi:hypothetical protein
MDMSKLSASDRRIFITAVVVVLGGIVSIIDRWGIGGILGGLAGLGAALVVLQPQLMPTMKLPAPKATSLLVLGGIAAIGFLLSALQYIGFVFDIRLYTILFDIALVAAIVLAYFAWIEYQAASKGGAPAAPSAPASSPPPPPPSMEPPAGES